MSYLRVLRPVHQVLADRFSIIEFLFRDPGTTGFGEGNVGGGAPVEILALGGG